MDDHKQLLLAEYKVNVDLWKHDDNLRQQRTGNYLTINSILLVALGTLLNFNSTPNSIAIIGIGVSIFGLILSFIWKKILKRNYQYIKFRRLQLLHIESHLTPMSTFTNIYDAFYKEKKIKYEDLEEEFILPASTQQSSTLTEGSLPIFITFFWGIILIICFISLVKTYPG